MDDEKYIKLYGTSKYKYFMSFTRNKNYEWNVIRITFDKNKLKNHYKFLPIEYYNASKPFKFNYKSVKSNLDNFGVQSEERILFKNDTGVENWLKYTVRIDLMDRIYNYDTSTIPKEEVLNKIDLLNKFIEEKKY